MTDKDKTVQAGGGIRPDQIHAYAGGICQKCGLDRVKGNFTFCSAPDKTVGGRFARIPHCPGYWAREDGTIWSSKVLGGPKTHDSGTPFRKLATRIYEDGSYRAVKITLKVGRKSAKFYVAPLVLSAFAGPKPEGMEACHENGDGLNNHLSNLRWDTHANNVADMGRHGTVQFGAANRSSKLNEESVRSLRRDYKAGVKSKDLALKYGISPSHADAVAKGKDWEGVW
jgi:hypothetical protein